MLRASVHLLQLLPFRPEFMPSYSILRERRRAWRYDRESPNAAQNDQWIVSPSISIVGGKIRQNRRFVVPTDTMLSLSAAAVPALLGPSDVVGESPDDHNEHRQQAGGQTDRREGFPVPLSRVRARERVGRPPMPPHAPPRSPPGGRGASEHKDDWRRGFGRRWSFVSSM